MKIKILALIFLSLFITSCIENQASDPPPEGAAAAPMYNHVTELGLKIQDNGYNFDPDALDNAFLKTESCLGYADTSADIYIVLKEPYTAIPCTSLPETGCGGIYQFPVITISADFVRLEHEYIHYFLHQNTNDSDPYHQKQELFDQCS